MSTFSDAARTVDDRALADARRGGRVLRDTFVIARRNVKNLLRQPQLLVFSTVQPVMLVLLFNYVFGNALEGVLPPGVEYVDFFIPGVLIQVVAFGTQQTAVGMAQDFQEGIVDRFRSLPMARSAVLGGRVVADAGRIAWTVVLIAGVGWLLGWRPRDGWWLVLPAFALVIAFGLAMSWITAWIGMRVRDPEAAQTAGFVWVFPLSFASSAFVRVETFPGWLQSLPR